MSREEVRMHADRNRLQPPGRTAPGQVKLPSPPPTPKRDRKPADMHSELKMAAAICVEIKEAVVSMFSKARMGGQSSAGAQNLVEGLTRHPQPRRAHQPGAAPRRLTTTLHYTPVAPVCANGGAGQAASKDQRRLAVWRACCNRPRQGSPFRWPCSQARQAHRPKFTVHCAATRWRGYHAQGGRQRARCIYGRLTCTTTKRWTDRATDKLAGEGISVIACRMTAICDGGTTPSPPTGPTSAAGTRPNRCVPHGRVDKDHFDAHLPGVCQKHRHLPCGSAGAADLRAASAS